MGELILCKKPIAAVPYYIDEASLNVYSLEELCYYISHNVYLISSDFMSIELCNWIGKEIGYSDEEELLIKCIQEDAPLHKFVEILLRISDYLSGDEIKKIIETIETFENKSPWECAKIRADRLLDRNKIVDAIYSYENILDNKVKEKAPKEFIGDIWHNLGVCYSRLFFFDEACVCFEYAYQLNRKKISLEAMLCAYRCKKDEEGFNMQVAKYFVPDDIVEKIKKFVSDTSASTDVRNFDSRINNMKLEFYDENSYQNQLASLINRWKEEYNLLCNI